MSEQQYNSWKTFSEFVTRNEVMEWNLIFRNGSRWNGCSPLEKLPDPPKTFIDYDKLTRDDVWWIMSRFAAKHPEDTIWNNALDVMQKYLEHHKR